MVYKADFLAWYDFKNLLLASTVTLQIIEISPIITVSMNWYFSIPEISYKLTSVNLSIAY